LNQYLVDEDLDMGTKLIELIDKPKSHAGKAVIHLLKQRVQISSTRFNDSLSIRIGLQHIGDNDLHELNSTASTE